jgi:hypothetical protein
MGQGHCRAAGGRRPHRAGGSQQGAPALPSTRPQPSLPSPLPPRGTPHLVAAKGHGCVINLGGGEGEGGSKAAAGVSVLRWTSLARLPSLPALGRPGGAAAPQRWAPGCPAAGDAAAFPVTGALATQRDADRCEPSSSTPPFSPGSAAPRPQQRRPDRQHAPPPRQCMPRAAARHAPAPEARPGPLAPLSGGRASAGAITCYGSRYSS